MFLKICYNWLIHKLPYYMLIVKHERSEIVECSLFNLVFLSVSVINIRMKWVDFSSINLIGKGMESATTSAPVTSKMPLSSGFYNLGKMYFTLWIYGIIL